MTIVYLTAGTVGAGHLVRGLALHRGLERAGYRGRYVLLTPPVPFAAVRHPVVRELAIDPRDIASAERAYSSPLAGVLGELEPDVLVVDLFWAVVSHLLPLLRCEAWLLVRSVPEVWFQGPAAIPFRRERFARLLAIEPCPVPVAHEPWMPLVIANPDELLAPAAAREALGARDAGPVDIIVHAGVPGELDQLRAVAPAGALTLDLHQDRAPFPAATSLHVARSITCGAGYNAYWEARWLGHDGRTRFVPFRRRLDNQARRLEAGPALALTHNGADSLARALLGRS